MQSRWVARAGAVLGRAEDKPERNRKTKQSSASPPETGRNVKLQHDRPLRQANNRRPRARPAPRPQRAAGFQRPLGGDGGDREPD